MRISYLIPEDQYAFFRDLIPPMSAAGIDVVVNRVDDSTDMILAGILPITHQWFQPLEQSRKPYILWHWDMYSFTDYDEPRWDSFLRLLPRARDIWSCSYETARQLKELTNLDSAVIPAWVNMQELSFDGVRQIQTTALYAASGCGFGKRIEWAERACQLERIPLTVLRNQTLPRAEYVRAVSTCRVYLMTAFEESNGTIPAMEAAACGRPLVLADIPSNREVFGRHGYYFRSDDFGSLRTALVHAWGEAGNGRYRDASSRVVAGYSLSKVAPRIVRRLRELWRTLDQD